MATQVVSRHATSISLVLVRAAQEPDGSSLTPHPSIPGCLVGAGYLEIALDPVLNRTGDCWHICVDSMKNVGSMCYAWRADGPEGGANIEGAPMGGGAPGLNPGEN